MPVCQPSLNTYLETQNTAWMNTRSPVKKQRKEGNTVVRVKDFSNLKGVSLEFPDKSVRPSDVLLRGKFFRRELRDGLILQCSTLKEELAYSSTSVHGAGLSCIFMLKGHNDIAIGKESFDLRGSNNGVLNGTAFIKTTSEAFKKTTFGPQEVRRLVVTASKEWLDIEGLDTFGKQGNAVALNTHLRTEHWPTSPRLRQCIEEIFTPKLYSPELLHLHLESRAIEIALESVARLMNVGRDLPHLEVLSRHETIRYQRAVELIHANLAEPLSVEYIARESGVSATVLQRLFHRVDGASVFEYVRRTRLDQAMVELESNNLSVQEASTVTGYKNPANFATAFKKQFGIRPSEAATRKLFAS